MKQNRNRKIIRRSQKGNIPAVVSGCVSWLLPIIFLLYE